MKELVIASRNIHKIREFKEMLPSSLNIDIRSLLDFPHYVPPEEDEKTFRLNAIKKAEHAAKNLNKWVLADDSGLIVPALNGAPGIFSARYAGSNATDAENRKKLLANMEHLDDEKRHGYFECCLAFASPSELIRCVCATCEGTIIKKEQGGLGFGYDPIFMKIGYKKTFAELESTVKNKVSHRGKALEKLLPTLESIFK